MAGKLLPFRHAVEAAARLSDEALLLACASGDNSALGCLFDRFHETVFRFLGRYLGPRATDIDDLVQMTFLEVRRSSAQFRGQSTVRGWILGVAVNVARHHVRGEVRRRRMLQGVASCAAPGGSGPDEAAARHQMVARLQEELPALGHDLRAPFVLCVLEEIPSAEAARVLDLREGTVRRRVHEARQRLREALEWRTP